MKYFKQFIILLFTILNTKIDFAKFKKINNIFIILTYFVSFLILGSSLINFWSLGSPAMHSDKVWGLEGSNGIILEILSTKP